MPTLALVVQEKIDALIARGALDAATEQAQRATQQAKDDPVAWQVLGLLLTATGKPYEAEKAFTEAVTHGETRNATPTGLERECVAGRPLGDALRKLKPLFFTNAGIAAARNNRGALRLLRGELTAAQEDLDYAAVAAPESALPWINATYALLRRNHPEQAELSARGALQRQPELGRAHAALAEVELERRQLTLALEDTETALALAPGDAHVLFVRSQALRAAAQGRDADRVLIQALALNPTVSQESQAAPFTGQLVGQGGNAAEQHTRLIVLGKPGGSNFRIQAQRVQQQVEARTSAEQADERVEAILGSQASNWSSYATLRRSAGGRPGATVSRFGIAPQPGATFRLNQEQLSLLHTSKALVWHFGWNRDAVVLQRSAATARLWPLQDERLALEGRWQAGGVQAGIAWNQNRRQRQGTDLAVYTSAPIEPAEQLLPEGTWSQGLAWAFFQQTLSPRLQVTAGPVALKTRQTLQVQPFLDIELKGITPKPVHFRMRPRVAEAAGDLFPDQARADRPQENRIDRHEDSAQSLNRSPLLTGAQGRIQESSFAVPFEHKGITYKSTLFHRRMEDVYTQAADPRVATTLALTAISRAEAFGIEQEARWRLGRALNARAEIRYQEAYGRISSPTFSGADYPTRVAQASRGLSNFPRWQGGLQLNSTLASWSVGTELQFVGERPFWTSVRSTTGTPETYLSQASAATGLNLHLTRRFSDEGTFSLSLFNLTETNFYPGYPGTVTAVSGFFWRY